MADYKQRMLQSPQSRKVMQAVFDVAMDPEHKHFPACSKMVMDRIAPISAFTESDAHGGKPQITVNISGVGDVSMSQDPPIEGEVVDES